MELLQMLEIPLWRKFNYVLHKVILKTKMKYF